MIFESSENRNRFLNGDKYYCSKNDYCIGNTIADAADIIRRIAEEGNAACGNGCLAKAGA